MKSCGGHFIANDFSLSFTFPKTQVLLFAKVLNLYQKDLQQHTKQSSGASCLEVRRAWQCCTRQKMVTVAERIPLQRISSQRVAPQWVPSQRITWLISWLGGRPRSSGSLLLLLLLVVVDLPGHPHMHSTPPALFLQQTPQTLVTVLFMASLFTKSSSLASKQHNHDLQKM